MSCSKAFFDTAFRRRIFATCIVCAGVGWQARNARQLWCLGKLACLRASLSGHGRNDCVWTLIILEQLQPYIPLESDYTPTFTSWRCIVSFSSFVGFAGATSSSKWLCALFNHSKASVCTGYGLHDILSICQRSSLSDSQYAYRADVITRPVLWKTSR